MFITFAEIKLPAFCVPYARLKPTFAEPKDPYDVVTSPCGCGLPSPERVVATMTSEVLPPYSAEGAPGITSSDCTESIGIWLEKVLLVWSVIGWPSTEKELDA